MRVSAIDVQITTGHESTAAPARPSARPGTLLQLDRPASQPGHFGAWQTVHRRHLTWSLDGDLGQGPGRVAGAGRRGR